MESLTYPNPELDRPVKNKLDPLFQGPCHGEPRELQVRIPFITNCLSPISTKEDSDILAQGGLAAPGLTRFGSNSSTALCSNAPGKGRTLACTVRSWNRRSGNKTCTSSKSHRKFAGILPYSLVGRKRKGFLTSTANFCQHLRSRSPLGSSPSKHPLPLESPPANPFGSRTPQCDLGHRHTA